MTAREIIKARLNHEGTEVTPYTVSFEPLLYQKFTEYYKDENWEKKKLRKFMTDFAVDTVQLQPIDKVYSIDAYGAVWRMDKCLWHLEKPPLDEPSLDLSKFPPRKNL